MRFKILVFVSILLLLTNQECCRFKGEQILCRTNKFRQVAPDICGASDWLVLIFILLSPGIFRRVGGGGGCNKPRKISGLLVLRQNLEPALQKYVLGELISSPLRFVLESQEEFTSMD
jgi:hypothetical protein